MTSSNKALGGITCAGSKLSALGRWILLAVMLISAACEQGQRVPFCRLDATPNPALRCEDGPPTATHLSWFCESPVLRVELRVGSRDGRVFAQSGPYGNSQTGLWLNRPTEFFLIRLSNEELLARVKVDVEVQSCEQN